MMPKPLTNEEINALPRGTWLALNHPDYDKVVLMVEAPGIGRYLAYRLRKEEWQGQGQLDEHHLHQKLHYLTINDPALPHSYYITYRPDHDL